MMLTGTLINAIGHDSTKLAAPMMLTGTPIKAQNTHEEIMQAQLAELNHTLDDKAKELQAKGSHEQALWSQPLTLTLIYYKPNPNPLAGHAGTA